jgi:hypothetical protein
MELRGSLRGAVARLGAVLAAPFRELLAALDGLLAPPARSGATLAKTGAGLLAGWWLYVPVHELAHAFGCLAAGGEVTRLEIDAIYGAKLLEPLVPFVRSGSEYAGRLSGFDTHGSDLVYLATVLAPFLFTLFPGVWWLRRAATANRPFSFGAALPWAYAPFVALPGDAYEIGSLLAVQLPPFVGSRALVGDDLFRVAAGLDFAGRPALALGFALSCLLGVVWAWGWHRFAGAIATRFRAPGTVASR